jgi:hypothetical protein
LSINLSSDINKFPCSLVPRRLGDFDHEPDNPDYVMSSGRTKDRYSLDVYPLRAVAASHNSELARGVRGAIGSKGLHRDLIKNAPILRMHPLQEQMKLRRRIEWNSENVPELV